MLLRKAGLVLGRADTGELVLESCLVISDGPIPSESTKLLDAWQKGSQRGYSKLDLRLR